MEEPEITEIEKRFLAATAGPWRAFVEGRDHTSGSSFIMTGSELNRGLDLELYGLCEADLDFIANARQDIPLLVSEIRRLNNILKDFSSR